MHETNQSSFNTVSPFEIDVEKFSSYSKIIRITAWCIRFIYNTKKGKITEDVLTPEELKVASDMWIKFTQGKNFPEVIRAIDKKGNNSIKDNLGVEKDEDGVLRCG